MVSTYESVLDSLYDRYYRNDASHSRATSSHWRDIGGATVHKAPQGWMARGYGFGGAPERTISRAIKNAPRLFLAWSLFKRYALPREFQKACIRLAQRLGVWLDYDFIRQALSLNKILNTLPIKSNKKGLFSARGITRICVIGDGYGFCSSLLKEIDPDLSIVTVNLGRILFFDVLSIARVHPASSADFFFVEAEQTPLIEGMSIDLFINIASMQEMNPSTVADYFRLMRTSSAHPTYFYCCNRLEKILPDGTVVTFSEYPWEESAILFDELCPWYQKYPISTPPWWLSFDGPIQHRLVQLNS